MENNFSFEIIFKIYDIIFKYTSVKTNFNSLKVNLDFGEEPKVNKNQIWWFK